MQDHLEREDDVETLMATTLRWAVSYGDLMSLMMVFFLLLYTLTSANTVQSKKQMEQISQMFGGKADAKLANMVKQVNIEDNLAKEMRALVEAANLTGYVVIKVDDFQIKLMMTEAITFDWGSTNISPRLVPVLDKLAQLLKVIDNRIEIEGHTDDSPGSNFEISVHRSLSVMNYLVAKGVSPDRIAIMGMGAFRPLVKNDTEENRARNRRVEVNILRKSADLMKNS